MNKILLLGSGELGKELTLSLKRFGCYIIACDKYTQQIDDYWNFTSFTTFDKRKKIKMYNFGAKLKYEDECFGVSFLWTRQFTHNPEDPTSNNFAFLFSIKEIMESDL